MKPRENFNLKEGNLCNNSPNTHVLKCLTELIFTVHCNFYRNLLAELLPVFYCKIYNFFFTAAI